MAFATFQQVSVVVDIMKSLFFFAREKSSLGCLCHVPGLFSLSSVNVNQSAPPVVFHGQEIE